MTASSVLFSLTGLTFVFLVHRARPSVRKDMDWLDDESPPREERNDEETTDTLRADLVALGMAATAPRQAKRVARVRNDVLHPATDNDTDVVRLKRVSEEEETERYFAAFGSK